MVTGSGFGESSLSQNLGAVREPHTYTQAPRAGSAQPVATTADFKASLSWKHGAGNTVVFLLDRGDLATEDDDFGDKPSGTLIVPPGFGSGLAGSLPVCRRAAFLFLIDTSTGDVWVATHASVVDKQNPDTETYYRNWQPFYFLMNLDTKTRRVITLEKVKEFDQAVDEREGK